MQDLTARKSLSHLSPNEQRRRLDKTLKRFDQGMWTCKYKDHTYDQSKKNLITPISHLFLETEETSCKSRLSHLLYK